MVELNEQPEVKELNGPELETAFNLDNEDELTTLSESLEVQSMFFNPERDISYKIKLTSSQMQIVEKEFENEKVIKYGISVAYESQEGESGEGVWQVGKVVARAITQAAKDQEGSVCDITFLVTKTGSGKETKYNISKSF